MNSGKLEQYKKDLQAQREEVKRQLAMLDGAIQLTDQLIEETKKEEADNTASSESLSNVEGISQPISEENNPG